MRNLRTFIAAIGVTAMLAQPALATTWGESKVRDPVSGNNIKVQEPMSSGSYIYSWPGREDQVFWPMTDDNWLWFNPRSGYGAFGDDFEKLEGEALERVKAWLAANYDKARPPATRIEKLQWLEKLYGQRGMDEDFWCFFNRLMAFEYSQDDAAKSLEYVKKALPMLERQLANPQDDDARIPTLYLLGEYHRRLGNPDASRSYFDQAKSAPYKNDEGETLVGSPYFMELIEEREKLGEAAAPAK
ncbi:MAG TPA: tetratricopeptide repeat protein [Steroidobacteraceae bacterium]|nr:tetratricopeptide repeat protein [Steroidobacteraceae bacterium]